MANTTQTDFFLNFQQFGDLKMRARDNSSEAAQSVAQQFEGLFVQQMLAAMRSASNIDGAQHSSYMDFYQDMYDKQLAQSIAGQDRLGIAKMIMQQIPGDESDPVDSAPETAETTAPLELLPIEPVVAMGAANGPASLSTQASREPVGVTAAASTAVTSRVLDDDFAEVAQIERANNRWHNPQTFIADLLPQAQQVATRLGVSAELLVAQSALETGWGRHTLKLADGRNSYNLFGIKAGPDWQGTAVNRNSLEFRNGILQNEASSFRAYTSPAQSLNDYVDFIQGNPRYQQALKQAGDDQAYIREIQNAGYATDPNYADKVLGILGGEMLQTAIARLNTGVTGYA